MNTSLVASWILAAMNAWHPLTGARSAAHRQDVAADIVAVASDPAEAPLFAGPDGRERTALLLASVAAAESSYREDVDRGQCREHECDHGRAFCMMQIQPGESGIVLAGDEWDYGHRVQGTRITGADLVRDRQLCVRVALHMLRTSLRHVHSLAEYTGEGREGPKARWRLERAKAWERRQPVPSDEGT